MKRHHLKLGVALSLAVAAGQLGCASDKAAAKAAAKGPAFNYVPLNDEACAEPADDAGKIAVATKLGTLGSHYSNGVATELTVCDTCKDDKLGALLKAATKPITIEGVAVNPPMLDLVNKALAYPYRHLTVSWQSDEAGATEVVLGQATKGGDAGSTSFAINAETLDKACKEFANVIKSTAKTTADADGLIDTISVTNADPGTGSFGFIVPTVLPDLGGSAEQIADQLGRTPGLNIRIGKPEVTLDVDSTGAGKGTIAGWIEPGQFQAFADAGVDLTQFVDDGSGSIRAVLSFKVVRATVHSAVDAHQARTAPPAADVAQTSPLTSDHPLPLPDSMGIIAECPDCDSDIKKFSYALEVKPKLITVPLDIMRINGSTEKFTMQVLDAKGKPMVGWYPQIVQADLRGGALAPVTPIDTAKKEGKAQFSFNRPYRPGGGLPPHPLCADLLTKGLKVNFTPNEGWSSLVWRPTNGAKVGAARWIYVCQDFTAKACPEHSGINLNGSCECEAGYEFAFDQCLDKAKYNCPAPGHLSLEPATKAVHCSCPVGTAYDATNGGKCVAHPCGPTTCKAGEMCIHTHVGDKYGSKCVAGDKEVHTTKSMPTSHAALAKMFDTMRKAKGGKADGLDDDDDFDGGGRLGDDPEDKVDAAPVAGAKQKPGLAHVHSMKFVGDKGGFEIAQDQKRTVNGENIPHAAQIEKHRHCKGDLHDMIMHVSDAQHKVLAAQIKAGTLPATVVMEHSEHRHDVDTGKYYHAHHNVAPTAYKIHGIFVEPKSVKGQHLVRLVMSDAHPEQMRHVAKAASHKKVKHRKHK